MTMRPRAVVVATTLLAIVLGAGSAMAAEPASGSVDADDRSASWNGAWFRGAGSVDPAACDLETDPQSALCDHYLLTVGVEDTFWQTREGRLAIGIVWPRAEDDFDLYVFETEGDRLWASTADTGTDERVAIEEPIGEYEVRVVPVRVESSGYLGWASLSWREPVSPEGTDPSEGGSTGGGGDGETGQEGTGAGDDPVGSSSTSVDPSTFADSPYASRAFDSATPSEPPSTTASPTPAPQPILPDPAAGVPDMTFEAAPTKAAPAATSVGRIPEAAWIVAALAVLALALTGLAVFERSWDDAGRGSKGRPEPGTSPRISLARLRRPAGRWPVDRRFVLWWG